MSWPIDLQPTTSRSDAARQITNTLSKAGFENAELDARFLVQGCLDISGAELIGKGGLPIGDHAERLHKAVARRLAYEPVSRILGWREFYGRRFEVTSDVLDPRSETETLISAVLEIADRRGWRNAPITIADVGVGSGAIIATLLLELPNATGIATDISESAMAVAQRNIAALGIEQKRLRFKVGQGILDDIRGVDLLVSNPPYIPTLDVAALDADVRNYDPHLALDGGPDGLAVYRDLANGIATRSHNLLIVVEIGAGQANEVSRIFETSGAAAIGQYRDLSGHIRVLAFERKEAKTGEF